MKAQETKGQMNESELIALFRRALIWLAAAGVVGTAIELAALRHWKSFEQIIPWLVLGILAIGVAAIAIRPSPARLKVVGVLAGVAAIGGLYGVITHVKNNYDAAILDYRYTDRWPTMSLPSKLWAAASGQVGPSPLLAPAILAQVAFCLWLATVHHPAKTAAGQAGSAGQAKRARQARQLA